MDLVDITTLGTVAGATAGAVVITQFVKVLGPDRWSGGFYRRIAAISGVLLMLAALIASGEVVLAGVVLAVLNGMIAGAAASASYDVAIRVSGRDEV